MSPPYSFDQSSLFVYQANQGSPHSDPPSFEDSHHSEVEENPLAHNLPNPKIS